MSIPPALIYTMSRDQEWAQVHSISSRQEAKVAKISQSEKIRRMAQRGKSNSEIAKALGIRYQIVWRTLNRPFQGTVPQEALVASGVRTVPDPLLEDEEATDAVAEQDDEPTTDPETEVVQDDVPVEA